MAKKKEEKLTDAPADLRSKRQTGRPSNEERTSNDALKTSMRLLAADLIADVRKNYKKFAEKDKVTLLGMLLKTLSLNDEAERDEEDLTFSILAQKYLKLKDEAHKAEEAIRSAMTSNTLNK